MSANVLVIVFLDYVNTPPRLLANSTSNVLKYKVIYP